MNDDLEDRLRALRPAALPRDLLRSLRSAEPSTPAERAWPWVADFLGLFPQPGQLAAAGLVGASVLVLAVWSLPGSRHPGSPGRLPHTRQATTATALPQEDTAASADHRRGVPFDLDGFHDAPLLTGAVLSGGLGTRSGGGFHLEMPAGRVRLDCGYTLVGNDFNNYPFGKFNLNVSDSF